MAFNLGGFASGFQGGMDWSEGLKAKQTQNKLQQFKLKQMQSKLKSQGDAFKFLESNPDAMRSLFSGMANGQGAPQGGPQGAPQGPPQMPPQGPQGGPPAPMGMPGATPMPQAAQGPSASPPGPGGVAPMARSPQGIPPRPPGQMGFGAPQAQPRPGFQPQGQAPQQNPITQGIAQTDDQLPKRSDGSLNYMQMMQQGMMLRSRIAHALSQRNPQASPQELDDATDEIMDQMKGVAEPILQAAKMSSADYWKSIASGQGQEKIDETKARDQAMADYRISYLAQRADAVKANIDAKLKAVGIQQGGANARAQMSSGTRLRVAQIQEDARQTLEYLKQEAETERAQGHDVTHLEASINAAEASIYHTQVGSMGSGGSPAAPSFNRPTPGGRMTRAAAGSPPLSAFRGEGVPVKFANGQTWTLKSGKPVRVR